MPRLVDMTGMRVGRLVVLERAGVSNDRKATWRCQCDCGGEIVTVGKQLRDGTTSSCGCLRRENSAAMLTVHGHGRARGGNRSPTFISWANMKQRCLDPKATSFPRYGAIGVVVCERWATFQNFLADMGERPPGTSLDRIDPTGNYEPGNCRWADAKTQALNTRKRREKAA